jgi:hypothetical protein
MHHTTTANVGFIEIKKIEFFFSHNHTQLSVEKAASERNEE